jgi:hypothetical protein
VIDAGRSAEWDHTILCFVRLVADIESDLGGSDRLSAIERALVEGPS